jgi:hypothetical protein
MKFRFSLKWLLAVMAYLAFVLMAVLQQSDVWDHLLWLIHGLMLLVMTLVAFYYRGEAQAVAIGFLLFFNANVATERWASQHAPAELLKAAMGIWGFEFHVEGAQFRQ